MMSAPTFAANVTLDFEGTTAYGSVGDFYASHGITFGGDALAFDNTVSPPDLPVFDNPANGTRVLSVVGNGEGTMNVDKGFIGQLTFAYSSVEATSIRLFSGLNGTGDLLSTIELDQNATNGGCASSVLCFWDTVSLDFAGVARSVTFGDATAVAGFDNVSVNAVPLPAAGWLLMSALGGVGAWSRRKRAA